MEYRVDSQTGAYIFDTAPLSTEELQLRNEEIDWLVAHGRSNWSLVNGRLATKGKWTGRDHLLAMGQANYTVLGANPLPTSLAGLTTTTTEQGLIPAADIGIYTPLAANQQVPQAWRILINGMFTSPASTGTLTITPRLGNANTSPSLGASAALAQTSSLTSANFGVQGDIVIRTQNLPGANATANGSFDAQLNTTVNGATSVFGWGTNGTVSFDSTLTTPGANGGGLWVGMTGVTAFPTYTVQQIIWLNWN